MRVSRKWWRRCENQTFLYFFYWFKKRALVSHTCEPFRKRVFFFFFFFLFVFSFQRESNEYEYGLCLFLWCVVCVCVRAKDGLCVWLTVLRDLVPLLSFFSFPFTSSRFSVLFSPLPSLSLSMRYGVSHPPLSLFFSHYVSVCVYVCVCVLSLHSFNSFLFESYFFFSFFLSVYIVSLLPFNWCGHAALRVPV